MAKQKRPEPLAEPPAGYVTVAVRAETDGCTTQAVRDRIRRKTLPVVMVRWDPVAFVPAKDGE